VTDSRLRGPAGQQRHHGEEQRYGCEDLSGLQYLHCLCPGREMTGSAQPLVGQMIHRFCLTPFLLNLTVSCLISGEKWHYFHDRVVSVSPDYINNPVDDLTRHFSRRSGD
jgi:hypothetical protein